MPILGQEDGFVGGPENFTAAQNGLSFRGNYDGIGTSSRIYVTDGNGVSIPYPAATIDRVIITLTDPRYTDAASAPAVKALAENFPLFDGEADLIDSMLTSGSVSDIDAGDEVWAQLINLDGSYYAIRKLKIVSVY
jgi:hypothetical protein